MIAIFQNKYFKRGVIGFVLGLIALAMVISLGVGPAGSASATRDAVATVDGQDITLADVQRRMQRISARQNIPRQLEVLYARDQVDTLIFTAALEYQARHMGLGVTDEEQAERIKRILPAVFAGNVFVGRERYEQEVVNRTGMSLPEFEEEIRKQLLEEKVLRLVSDGIRATPAELQNEFRKKNEKVRIDYVVVKPADLESKINPSDAELSAFFEKNKSRYPVAEKRSVRYVLLDTAQLRQRVTVSESELRAYYNSNLSRYTVQNRARVSHILFKTVGKSDAEIEETRRKAEDVLKQARKGAKFDELAKKNSEDTANKDKGGDLDWIGQGQTVAEFEKVAFSLPKGTISDLVKTEYGFHIIKVVDRENARTQTLEEVRESIHKTLAANKAENDAQDLADKMAEAVRKGRQKPIAGIARQFSLAVVETAPAGPRDAIGDLGNTRELHEEIARLRKDELSLPIHLDRGTAVLSVKDILPAHSGTLAEARTQVFEEYRREKSIEMAASRAQELAARAKAGEDLSKAARALGLDLKTSDAFARTGSVADLGSARQLSAAFTLPVGAVSPATQLGGNWAIFRVNSHEEVKPEEFEKQKNDLEQQVLREKVNLAYGEFRNELQARLYKDGLITINRESYKRLTNADWNPRR